MNEFLAMGGYAWFVWPAISVFLIVLALDHVLTRLRLRNALRQARNLEARRRQRVRT